MNVDDLIKTAVDDAVREVPPGFADGVIRRARRARRAARLVTAGGTAVVLAAAAVGVAALGAGGPSTGGPAGAGAGVVDLGALHTGPAPQVPWYEGGALHLGTESTPAELSWDRDDSPVIARVSGGYVVWSWQADPADANGRATLTLIRDDGTRVDLAPGAHPTWPAVSADGERFAWGLTQDWTTDEQARADGLTSPIVVADASGAEVARLPAAPGPTTRPWSFLADGRLLLEASANEAWGVYAWRPGGDLTLVADGTGVWAVSPVGTLAVLQSSGPFEVTDLATGATLWQYADGYASAFSPDGKHLAVVERPDGLETPDELVVYQAGTGDEVARLAFESIGDPRWESPTTIVVHAYQGSTAAYVRCAVDGGCELATEPRQIDDDPATFDSPYAPD